MNAFEKGLRRPIPLEKAASFFVDLKRHNQIVAPADDALFAEAVKVACAPPTVKTASSKWDSLVAKIKLAGDDSMPASSDALPPPEGAEEAPDPYVAEEMAAQEVENTNAIEFYKQKMQELRDQAAASDQQAQEAQSQVADLQQQQDQHDGQIAAATQEGQIAQQAAMQQVQSANTAASTAMSQAVDAENRALTAKGQEAAAKIQQQQVRSQLFDMASQGLPGTEPDVEGDPSGATGAASEGLAPLDDTDTEVADPSADPNADPNADPSAGADAGGQGAAPASPDAGQGGGGPSSGGLNEAGESASSDGMPGQEDAPAPAPGAAASPTAVPPGGGSASDPPQANGTGGGSSTQQNPSTSAQRHVSTKVGSVEEKIAAALPHYLRDPKIVGALAGGILGTGAAGAEVASSGKHLDKLRGSIEKNEAISKKPGLHGFSKTYDLARDKAMLTLGEATKRHPVAATITGGLIGAGAGYDTGPKLHKLVSEAAKLHKKS